MFCPHCHNKIPDGSNFCPLCYANLVGVKQQEKESEAETDAPRPEAEARAEEKQRQTRLYEGQQTEQARAGQDADDYCNRPDPDSGADYCDDRAIHVRGGHAGTVVNTPVPQATQQPQQENNFIVFGATNTPAPQLTATPNIEITPTPRRRHRSLTTYKTLRKGRPRAGRRFHAAGADFAGLPQGRERRQLRHGHQDGG